jgi:hypothetical protein
MSRWFMTVVAVSCIVLAATCLKTANRKGTLGNAINIRLLPQPQYARALVRQGLNERIPPLLAGVWMSGPEWQELYTNNSANAEIMDEYSAWLLAKEGQKAFALFLISHPGYTFGNFVTNWDRIFWPETTALFEEAHLKKKKPHAFRLWVLPFYLFGLCVIPFLFRRDLFRQPYAGLLGWIVVLLGTAFASGFLSYHGDAMAVERHSLNASLSLYIFFAFLICLSGGLIADKRRRARGSGIR